MRSLTLCLLIALSGCAGTDEMNGLFDVDPNTACSIVLADADAQAGIATIGTKIKVEGVAYIRRGKCSPAEFAMFKVANRLQ